MTTNCRICMFPEGCDCICSTCMEERMYQRMLAQGKSDQMREYAEAHGIETIELNMTKNTPSYTDFILKWVK